MVHNVDSKKKLVRLAKNGVSQEYIGPFILEKIQMYTLIRAELLYTLCHEIPCNIKHLIEHKKWKEICLNSSRSSFIRLNVAISRKKYASKYSPYAVNSKWQEMETTEIIKKNKACLLCDQYCRYRSRSSCQTERCDFTKKTLNSKYSTYAFNSNWQETETTKIIKKNNACLLCDQYCRYRCRFVQQF